VADAVAPGIYVAALEHRLLEEGEVAQHLAVAGNPRRLAVRHLGWGGRAGRFEGRLFGDHARHTKPNSTGPEMGTPQEVSARPLCCACQCVHVMMKCVLIYVCVCVAHLKKGVLAALRRRSRGGPGRLGLLLLHGKTGELPPITFDSAARYFMPRHVMA
jgi:hypothetical protein